MDTTARRRKVRQTVISQTESELYNHDVYMYKDHPQHNIPLHEFEELALERLQLLRIIEEASLRGHKQFSEEWRKSINEDLAKHGLKKYMRLMRGANGKSELDVQARRADHLSHYILRLAYCRSEDLRRWFLSRELEWFKLRFIIQTPQSITQFLELNNLTYQHISTEERDQLKNDLILSTPGMSNVSCDASDIYKVNFSEVLPLVKNRRVYLHRGYAYILTSDLIVCVQSKFRASLNEALNIYSHRLSSIDDDRLNSLLTNLHNAYTGRNYIHESDKEGIDPASLDIYAKKNFPLCMSHLHHVFKSSHHLKHYSRLQYGLFLKGIGLLYEDAMEYWRQEFTKKIDNEKFDKEYSYLIRHMYGKAGGMTDYSPYSCMKIIMGSVGTGEHHGCPFKHWDSSILKQKIVEQGISSEGVNSVLEMASDGHYQIACTKYFECIHGQAPSTAINHPNQYFAESTSLAKEKEQKRS
nr:DNA primase large subunit-like [Leptinotarsa decemlineata]